MLKTEDAYFLGKIIKKQGLNGAFLVSLDTTHPEDYLELDSVYVELHGNLIPFFLDEVTLLGSKKAKFIFADIEDPHQISELESCNLFLPLSSLPKLSGNEFYFFEVEGFEVFDESEEKVGVLQEVIDNPAQPILQIQHVTGKEVLLPKIDETVKKIDREKKLMVVKFPPGLLEIYL